MGAKMKNISERVNQLPSSKRLLLALDEALTKLEEVGRSKNEPIAIIGMGCRFPGNANDPEAFWQLLHHGVDAITEIPPQRWDINSYYDPDPNTVGKMYVRHAGLLQQVDQFDPQFFGISPREALSMDPQQRLLLEVSWEALENAGVAPHTLCDSQTGVFLGIGQNDYARLQLHSGEHSRINAYDGTGNGFCFAAGRLSYVLGLQGPSLAVDTACSSSLIAIHLACQSLRGGECNLALAAAVQLILSPEVTIFLSRAQALASDGRCKTFDSTANGYGRGEGCGVVVLKRLHDAIADGDNILALIRGSAVNHDGPSSGFTVPNKIAQQALLHKALANAKVKPSQVSYVETHGTGTPLGDPVEVKALAGVFGEERVPENPLIIGSVKTNIGHLETAAGIAGLIKVVLSLQNQQIPPHLHFKQPNPHINWDELPVMVPTSLMPWHTQEKPRLAGVSSFGMSGTNAHVILEEAPLRKSIQADVADRPVHLLTLSTKTEQALKQLACRYGNYLATHSNSAIADICFTANTGRSHFNHKLCVLASSSTELMEKLNAFGSGQKATGIWQGRLQDQNQPGIVFLFTGEGSQYRSMGRQIYETQPTFRSNLDYCSKILRPYLEKPLLEVLYPVAEENRLLDQPAYTQPALFAFEYSLFQLWQSWGISPKAVIGHGVGEYVAACVAGVFTLEDGLKLVAERGRLIQTLPHEDKIVTVFASEAQVAKAILPYAKEVAIAAVNSPKNVLISGKSPAFQAVLAVLKAEEIQTESLNVFYALQSPLMDPILATFKQVAKEVTYSPPHLNIISNITGETVAEEMSNPDYWCLHIQKPVKFAAGLQRLDHKSYEIFIEIGPKPTLLEMGRQCLPEEDRLWLPSLCPEQEDWQQILCSLGELYVRGVSVNWYSFDQDYSRHRLQLPTYPFQRRRYWVETNNNGHSNNNYQACNNGEVEALLQQTTELLPKLLQALTKQQQVNNSPHKAKQVSEQQEHWLLERLKDLPHNERLDFLIAHLQHEVATVLGLDASQLIEQKLGFFEMGMDSLLAIELRNRIKTNLGTLISPTLAFNYPNIESLANYLLNTVFGLDSFETSDATSQENNVQLTQIVLEVEQLSEEEVQNLLVQKLATL
jgi:acyl transferase domain-containing protein